MSSGGDDDEKTEDPTDKRRSEAREKGNIAKSTDLNAAAIMMAAATGLLFFGPQMGEALANLLRSALGSSPMMSLDTNGVTHHFQDIAQLLAEGVLPFILLMFGAALVINVGQIGILFTTEPLQIQWNRISPMSGFKRIASITSMMKLAVSIGKILIFATIVVWFVMGSLPLFEGLIDSAPITVLGYSSWMTVQLAFQLSAALLILAILDFSFQKWKHEQDMKMSKQEIRDEMKNMEGDPQIRHRRREIHRKIAEARELSAVPDADVVINNPTHFSVALKYDPDVNPAPIVVAKGADEIAFRIREIAQEHNVPMIERKPLARALYADVDVGHPIPAEMYDAFVEIMAYVYRLSGKKLKEIDPPTK